MGLRIVLLTTMTFIGEWFGHRWLQRYTIYGLLREAVSLSCCVIAHDQNLNVNRSTIHRLRIIRFFYIIGDISKQSCHQNSSKARKLSDPAQLSKINRFYGIWYSSI